MSNPELMIYDACYSAHCGFLWVCVNVCVSFRYSLRKPEHSNLTHPSPWRVTECSAWEEFLSYLLIREKLILSRVVCSCILPRLRYSLLGLPLDTPSSAPLPYSSSCLSLSPIPPFSWRLGLPFFSWRGAINWRSYWPARHLMGGIQRLTRDLLQAHLIKARKARDVEKRQRKQRFLKHTEIGFFFPWYITPSSCEETWNRNEAMHGRSKEKFWMWGERLREPGSSMQKPALIYTSNERGKWEQQSALAGLWEAVRVSVHLCLHVCACARMQAKGWLQYQREKLEAM